MAFLLSGADLCDVRSTILHDGAGFIRPRQVAPSGFSRRASAFPPVLLGSPTPRLDATQK
jgi:hypothetical protein